LFFHSPAAEPAQRSLPDAIASAEGVWQGALEGNGMRLRLQFAVSHDDQKQLVAGLDSPDQGVSGLPAIHVIQKDAQLFIFEIPSRERRFMTARSRRKNGYHLEAGRKTTSSRNGFSALGPASELVRSESCETLSV